ncbi:MAG TPA: SAM-dependent methyltransferase [Rhodospirillaceae bacterium]|nr:SAM-dependent methyltransferase [Rhodospirillaceae bacterium]HAA91449.1 SAM-dependent methyltransferase [Rhodospirillaceae bacterium]HAT36295.1 SAM-dependent methyltransferase [Rhodospirillaceae bacterium]|tara:strand:- start:263 stop:964 length:702 start_codon:yes stop_codon:yes gene_type:complete
MKECSKAINRRMADPNFMNRYFSGDGIDIGGAPDPLFLYAELFPKVGEVRTWDLGDGDATYMEGVEDETYDFVHSSHCLEHLEEPETGLKNWFRILKPEGYLVVTVPDEDLYEQGIFPSTFNPDHKWSYTICKTESWNDRSINIFDLLPKLGEAAEIVKVELLNQTYRYVLPRFDQTLTPIGESGIEFIVRKRSQEELAFCGLHKHPGNVDGALFKLLTGINKPKRKPAEEEE